jgi:excisionase family DNA binding protein
MMKKPDIFYDHQTGSRLFTAKQAAAYLNYHPVSIARLVMQGTLRPYRRAGRTLLFLKEALDQYQARNAWAARKMSMEPLAEAPPLPPTALTATVSVNLGFELLWQEVERVPDFRWEQIPLLRARSQEQYGERPTKLVVQGPDGGTWTITYEPPTWISRMLKTFTKRKDR